MSIQVCSLLAVVAVCITFIIVTYLASDDINYTKYKMDKFEKDLLEKIEKEVKKC